MKRKLLLLLLLCLGAVARAQTGGIKGVVKNIKDSVLSNALVEVIESGTGRKLGTDITDKDGDFILKPLLPGNYDVKVSFEGYSTKTVTCIWVRNDLDTIINIALIGTGQKPKPKPLAKGIRSLKEVTIRARPYEKPIIDPSTPYIGTYTPSEKIEKMPVREYHQVSKVNVIEKEANSEEEKPTVAIENPESALIAEKLTLTENDIIHCPIGEVMFSSEARTIEWTDPGSRTVLIGNEKYGF